MNYVEEALRGNQLAGARLIRLLEEGDPQGIEYLKALYPHTGRAFILGMTGPPGAGKSTLVDRIITEFRRRDLKVGVVAVDPSSPFSGGAILGDRVRMQRHATDPGVFVRSMATRGHLGGLSRATGEAVLVLDAMGYDVILIETVGVGQDEVEIVDMAHTTAVVCLPGMGDDIQAMKAGILEIGDLFIVNKADRPGADEVVKQLQVMLEMRTAHDQDAWRPPVLKTVAVRNEGIAEVVDAFYAHRDHQERTGVLAERKAKRQMHFFRELVKEMAAERIFGAAEGSADYARMLEDLTARRLDPYTAAETLLDQTLGGGNPR
ncbi:methylmalonyl Co-A mutase-associated GTPase MeaB [Deferrisoma camini]|uniref:methylmalonyl Co-A mutase-associated GTPase MeaB n=1 Tax=Deferrisoma camini TaxID=1035120 RepID=UPI00046CF6CC|nr:methylmalonyl Co-A mutase-associated GTPase MeaB [Deferrisoma camini]